MTAAGMTGKGRTPGLKRSVRQVTTIGRRLGPRAFRLASFYYLTVMLSLCLLVAAWQSVGLGATVIDSSSMAPALNRGGVLLWSDRADQALEIGDVVLFDRGDRLIAHRLIGFQDHDDAIESALSDQLGTVAVGGRALITRGDASSITDTYLVPPTDVIGVGRAALPYLGVPVLWLSENRPAFLLWLGVGIAASVAVGRRPRTDHARMAETGPRHASTGGSPSRATPRQRFSRAAACGPLVAALAITMPLPTASGQYSATTSNGTNSWATGSFVKHELLAAGSLFEAGISASNYTTPVSQGYQNWSAISTGGEHTCAIDGDGRLWCRGANGSGQLGDGSMISNNLAAVTGDTRWSSIDAGDDHSCATKSNGTLWCWGTNDQGEVGDGTTTLRTVPTQVGADTDWTAAAAGRQSSCGRKSTGTLWCWGDNSVGQVGDGTATDRTTPIQVGTDTDWASVTGYWDTFCAIKTTGTLWCWGDNGDGQIGDGTITNRNSPTQVGSDSNWAEVATGYDHTCAVRTNGTLWCWGDNAFGGLGDGTTTDRTTPVQSGSDTDWSLVKLGSRHSCGIKTGASLWCWGYNVSGQLGDGTGSNRASPTQVGSDTDWATVDGGTTHTCGLRTDSTQWCWGSNHTTFANPASNLALGRSTSQSSTSSGGSPGRAVDGNTSGIWNNNSVTHTNVEAQPWWQVDLGSSRVVDLVQIYNRTDPCCINRLNDFYVFVSESNLSGRSYSDIVNDSAVARVYHDGVAGSSEQFTDIGTGRYVRVQMSGSSEILSLAEVQVFTNPSPPGYVPAPTQDWTTMHAGRYHSCGVAAAGTLWCWGTNSSFQVGDGTATDRKSPTQVGSDTDWATVGAGGIHSCGLKSTGTLWCWGFGGEGRLGTGNTTSRSSPTQAGTDTDWASLEVGRYQNCAIKTAGTLWCWGYNNSGQLGDGTTTNRSSPVQVGTDTDWSMVDSGHLSTCAIKTDGTLWCWGYNGYGNLGDGTTTNRTTPVQVGASTLWRNVSQGVHTTCATRTDDTLWCWGWNQDGGVGDGTTTTRSTPTQISGSYRTVSLGEAFGCAIDTSDGLWCWGRNDDGQLGLGTTTNHTTPQSVSTLSDVDRVSAGYSHTLSFGSPATPTYVNLGQASGWHAAVALAAAHGGSLVQIDDATENQLILDRFWEDKAVYIYATDEVAEGTWLNGDGNPQTYQPWLSGEPNNDGGIQHYMVMVTSSGEWDDSPTGIVPLMFNGSSWVNNGSMVIVEYGP